MRRFSSSILENKDIPSLVPFIKQALECFSLSITLLESELSAPRIETIVFENCGEYIPTLLGFSAIPISKDTLNVKNQKKLCKLRVQALQTLSKFISICDASDDSIDKRLSKLCMEAILENQGLEALLSMLQVDPMDSIRLAISELIFILAVKNPMGKLALMLQHAVPIFLKSLNIESQNKVRNFICAILREFALVYPEELLKENIIKVATQLINLDSSADVRALSAEILEILFKNDSRTLQLLDDYSELAEILSNRLLKESDQDISNRDVVESVSKLLETLFCLKVTNFIRKFIEIGGFVSFIRIIKIFPIQTASLATRALRYLIQNAEYDTFIGYKITTHFPSLSVLLKSVLKQQQPDRLERLDKLESEQIIIAHKLLRVELALCLGIMFSMHPASRQHVHNELKSFPSWMSTLRSSLLKHLSLAELEYFSDVVLIDSSGIDLFSAFNDVVFQQEGPAIKYLFQQQEERFNNSIIVSPKHTRESFGRRSSLNSEEQIGKIKLFIIIYAIHLVLTPTENATKITNDTENTQEFEINSQHKESNKPFIPNQFDNAKTPRSEKSSRQSIYTPREDIIDNYEPSINSPRVRELSADIKKDLNLNLAAVNRNLQSPRSRNVSGNISGAESFKVSSIKKKAKKSPQKTVQQIRFEHGIFLAHLFSELHEDKVLQNKPDPSPYRSLIYKKFQQSARNSPYTSKTDSPKMLQKVWDDECVLELDLFYFEVFLEDFSIYSWETVLKRLKKHEKNTKKNFITCPQARNGKGRRTFLLDMDKYILPRIREMLEEFVTLINHHGVELIRVTVYLWRGKNKSIVSIHNENIVEILAFVRDYIAKSQNIPESISDLENTHADQIDEALKFEQNRKFTNIGISLNSELNDLEPTFDEDDDESVSRFFFKSSYSPRKVATEYKTEMHSDTKSELNINSDIRTNNLDTSLKINNNYQYDTIDDEEARELEELEKHVNQLEEKQRFNHLNNEEKNTNINDETKYTYISTTNVQPTINSSEYVEHSQIELENSNSEIDDPVNLEDESKSKEENIDLTNENLNKLNTIEDVDTTQNNQNVPLNNENIIQDSTIELESQITEEKIEISDSQQILGSIVEQKLDNELKQEISQEDETQEVTEQISENITSQDNVSTSLSVKDRLKARREQRNIEKKDPIENQVVESTESTPKENSNNSNTSSISSVRERIAQRKLQKLNADSEESNNNDNSTSSARDRVRDRLAARRSAS